ncbi:MAG: pilus assembly protein PilM [Candidatus Delongbacteria bacterium]|nr:pilus assembly protein PilM [Candidatus Delongbacteria bacterium]MBN2834662.1 pilus assembly protein PilM [Candidatus Delongbacteria bacterium]
MTKNDKKIIPRDIFKNKADQLSNIEVDFDKPLSFDEALKSDDIISDELITNDNKLSTKTEKSNPKKSKSRSEITQICAVFVDKKNAVIVLNEFDGRHYFLKKMLVTPVDYPIITEENLGKELTDQDIFNLKVEALKKGLDLLNINRKNTIFVSGVGGQSMVEQFKFTGIYEDQIHEKVKNSIMMPFENNGRVECLVLGTEQGQNGLAYNVLGVAIDNRNFFEALGLINSTGIECEIMDIEVISLLNLFIFSEKPDNNKVHCILDIGDEVSNIIIYSEKNGGIFKRNLEFTYSGLIKMISKNRDITKSEAIELVESTNFYTFITKAFEMETQENLNKQFPVKNYIRESLLGEIQKTFQYYSSKLSNQMPSMVYICGMGNILKDFDNFFSKTADIKAKHMDILANFKGSNEIKKYAQDNSHIIYKALGLSLRHD